jgi:cyclic pyranopterin phosphate synthase
MSLVEKCNLRCVYCMPEEGVKLTANEDTLTSMEFVRIARLFGRMGARKLRLTGGEVRGCLHGYACVCVTIASHQPTLCKDLCPLIAEIRAGGSFESIGITTNGILVRGLLSRLKAAGLTSLNISLDTLSEQRFEEVTRRKGLKTVLASIYAAQSAGYTVKVIRHMRSPVNGGLTAVCYAR